MRCVPLVLLQIFAPFCLDERPKSNRRNMFICSVTDGLAMLFNQNTLKKHCWPIASQKRSLIILDTWLLSVGCRLNENYNVMNKKFLKQPKNIICRFIFGDILVKNVQASNLLLGLLEFKRVHEPSFIFIIYDKQKFWICRKLSRHNIFTTATIALHWKRSTKPES